MGKFNVSMLRYLSSEEFRVLTAVRYNLASFENLTIKHISEIVWLRSKWE